MEIKQLIVEKDIVYLFTENPEEDLADVILEYSDRDSNLCLGYETPKLVDYTFLGKDYPCILLWFDGETDMIPSKKELSDLLK